LSDKKFEKESKKGSFGFFCRHWRCGFPSDRAFSRAFSHDSEFCFGYVGSACKRVTAFSAFPDTDALALNPCKAALWALVGFFEPSGDPDVTFSDGGAVSGA
jgi:hypothetical protein